MRCLTTTTCLQTITDQNWKIQSVSSFNGDPLSDIVRRNYSSGQTAAWIIGDVTTGPALNREIVGPR